MQNKRVASILVGMAEGLILGFFFFFFLAKSLISPFYSESGQMFDAQLQQEIGLLSLICGGTIGSIIGFIAGATGPTLAPRALMAKGIGSLTWLITTPVCWLVCLGLLPEEFNVHYGAGAVFTVLTFIFAIPLSHEVGMFLEKFRE